jgi:hypothetical protein
MLRDRWNGKDQQCGQCKMSGFHRNLRMPAREYSESPLLACFGGSSPTTFNTTQIREASCASMKNSGSHPSEKRGLETGRWKW